MFTAKQTRLMNTLGIVSDTDRLRTKERYEEADSEQRANGIPGQSFTDWLDQQVKCQLFIAKLNSAVALKDLV